MISTADFVSLATSWIKEFTNCIYVIIVELKFLRFIQPFFSYT